MKRYCEKKSYMCRLESRWGRTLYPVIPAEAGIQVSNVRCDRGRKAWTPAFAGVTNVSKGHQPYKQRRHHVCLPVSAPSEVSFSVASLGRFCK